MIRETSVEIDDLYKRWQVELESRYARRNRVRYIDHLLNELELLNLADAKAMPADLREQVKEFLDSCTPPAAPKIAVKDLTIPECMEALYDIQDTLLLGGEDDDDAL